MTHDLVDTVSETATLPGSIRTAPGRMRLRTLVLLRWLAIAGQTAALLLVEFGFDFHLPILSALTVVGLSALFNLLLMLLLPQQRLLPEREAALQLGLDVIQLSLLLAFTGGTANPFLLLMIAPVAVSASALRPAITLCLTGLSCLSVGVLALWRAPLPWHQGAPLELPPLYELGLACAVLIGLGFTSVYAWRVSAEAERLNQALAAAQQVLAREQKLSALGGLAAAAAHELGTPLATIHLVAKEMAQALPQGSAQREDAALLVSQSERCRQILRQLSRKGAEGDAVHDTLSLRAMLEEVAQPHHGLGPEISVHVAPAPGATGSNEPQLKRLPEIIHGLGNFVENAVGFAEARVEIAARWSAMEIEIVVRDDGPGFTPGVLPRLGEPYLSERRTGQAAGGMGLGFFIAKTLLERTGARVEARNRRAPSRGAIVHARWPRTAIETVLPARSGAAAAPE